MSRNNWILTIVGILLCVGVAFLILRDDADEANAAADPTPIATAIPDPLVHLADNEVIVELRANTELALEDARVAREIADKAYSQGETTAKDVKEVRDSQVRIETALEELDEDDLTDADIGRIARAVMTYTLQTTTGPNAHVLAHKPAGPTIPSDRIDIRIDGVDYHAHCINPGLPAPNPGDIGQVRGNLIYFETWQQVFIIDGTGRIVVITATPANTAVVVSATPVNPTYTPGATYTPRATNTALPTNTQLPTSTSRPTDTVEPGQPSSTPQPSYTPAPTYTPRPSYTPLATNTALPSPEPTDPGPYPPPPTPTENPCPWYNPWCKTPTPTPTECPTETPTPTRTPRPTRTTTSTPEPTDTPEPTATHEVTVCIKGDDWPQTQLQAQTTFGGYASWWRKIMQADGTHAWNLETSVFPDEAHKFHFGNCLVEGFAGDPKQFVSLGGDLWTFIKNEGLSYGFTVWNETRVSEAIRLFCDGFAKIQGRIGWTIKEFGFPRPQQCNGVVVPLLNQISIKVQPRRPIKVVPRVRPAAPVVVQPQPVRATPWIQIAPNGDQPPMVVPPTPEPTLEPIPTAEPIYAFAPGSFTYDDLVVILTGTTYDANDNAYGVGEDPACRMTGYRGNGTRMIVPHHVWLRYKECSYLPPR